MNLATPAVSSTFGSISRLGRTAESFASTAGDTPLARRVRGLLDELDDITADRALCARFVEPGQWLSELRTEERDVYEHLAEALSPQHA